MDNSRESLDENQERYLKLKRQRIQQIKRDGVAVSASYSPYELYPFFTFHPQDLPKLQDLIQQDKFVLELCHENGHPIMQFTRNDAIIRCTRTPYEPNKLFIHPVPEDLEMNPSKRYFIAKKNASISVHKSVLTSLHFDEDALTGPSKLIKQFIDQKITVIENKKQLGFEYQQDLNWDQNMAIKKAGKNVLTFIKGPPGCGKTKTIARLCKLMLQKKQQVMVGTVSNTGNLSILKELIAECVDQYRIDLINHIQTIRHDHSYQHELQKYFDNAQHALKYKIVLFTNLQAYEENCKYDCITRYFTMNQWLIRNMMKLNYDKDLTLRDIEMHLEKFTQFDKNNTFGVYKKIYSLYRQALQKTIEEADLLITTTVLSYKIHDKVGNKFGKRGENLRPYRPNVAILDEASQATWADTLCFLSFNPDRMILVGDEQQLDPTVISQQKILKQTVFSTLSMKNPDYFQMLKTQYRMHPEICQFPNIYFYQGQLTNGVNPHERQSNLYYFSQYPFVFLSHNKNQESYEESDTGKKNYYNSFEIECIESLLSLIPLSELKNVGIISTYGLQVKKMMERLSQQVAYGLTIKTCDGYQGGQKDYIFLSCVRSNDQGKIGFCAQPNRINVSLTRAKKCLIIIGDKDTLASELQVTSENVWKSLIHFMQKKGKIVKAEDVMAEISYKNSLDLQCAEQINKQQNVDYSSYYQNYIAEPTHNQSYSYPSYSNYQNYQHYQDYSHYQNHYYPPQYQQYQPIQQKAEDPEQREAIENQNKEKLIIHLIELFTKKKQEIKDVQEQEQSLKGKNKSEARQLRKLLNGFCSSVEDHLEQEIEKTADKIKSLFEKLKNEQDKRNHILRLTGKTCGQFITCLKERNLPNCTLQLKKLLSQLDKQQFKDNHIYLAQQIYKFLRMGMFHHLIYLFF